MSSQDNAAKEHQKGFMEEGCMRQVFLDRVSGYLETGGCEDFLGGSCEWSIVNEEEAVKTEKTQ